MVEPTSPTPSPFVPTRTISQLHSGTQFLIISAVGSIIVSLFVAFAMFLRKRRKAENTTAYITPLIH
ncbi:hypothetical protein TVAG_276920 [Trichomonas vaginalis G3]|uniref:Uncharacterized protein n=1 Tax=Trichomonas vaginalis (strain ATCC PRA-98 / G3) TaxID=412133 RepID=A2FUF2_TRIV3|nr:hypothetical protein TVAGG3_0883810 [Trichomonas vaginalis G3]EAX91473.1 hypothetical protein TVAG_276920 [Trichomonas vaginalis G3]KAI5502238.1 hypothetical protein TVAGG3_0883810 [Trichomonas vaginalis G3]|eukprot:XP_001304403.1 hypothetical protein [Trichomonas vaginalis G3]